MTGSEGFDMRCNFSVGMKVVCVDNQLNNLDGILPELEVGRLYTVRKIGFERIGNQDLLSVWLDEIYRDGFIRLFGNHCLVVSDFGFRPDRFKPVAKRKTDISKFQAMLTNTKVEEPA